MLRSIPSRLITLLVIIAILFCVRPLSADLLAAPRIVGGTITSPNEFPWQILLEIGGYMCGGSLIHPQWVLTASHCVEGMSASDATVYLGVHDQDTLNTSVNPYLQVASVSSILMHKSYNSRTTDYDIALLKLASPVTLTAGVRVIPLASTKSNSRLYAPGTSLTVSGWGTTSFGGLTSQYLQKVTVPLVARTSCNAMYGGGISARMICAGDTVSGGLDSCQGDSGGPLVGNQNGDWVQVGIVSFGNGCAEAAYPGVYTNVASLRTWVARYVHS